MRKDGIFRSHIIHIVTSTSMSANVIVVMDIFSGCLRQNVGESGYAISSWLARDKYSALTLTEGAKVILSSTSQR